MAVDTSEKGTLSTLEQTLKVTLALNKEYKESDDLVQKLAVHQGVSAAQALKNLNAAKKLKRENDSYLDSQNKINDAVKESYKLLSKAHKKTMANVDAMKSMGVAVDDANEGLDEQASLIAKSLVSLKEENQGYDDVTRAIEHMDAQLKKMGERNTVFGKKSIEFNNKIANQMEHILKLRSEGKGDKELAGASRELQNLQRQQKLYAEIGEDVAKATLDMRGWGKSAPAMGHAKEIKSTLGGFKNFDDPASMAKTGETLSALGDVMGEGVLKTLTMGAGGIAEILSGPIGMALGAVVLLGAKMIELDTKRKKWTQDYASMAGQQFSGDDFAKKASAFNKTIFDLERNIEKGVNFEEWQEVFKAINSAGISVDALTQRTGDLSKVQDAVFETSKELGLGMAQDAQLMGDSMQELKRPLSDIRDSYGYIANAAKKSGIESSRFMQVVNQSSLALGTYGNFLKVGAKNLENFAKSGVTSQKDAEDAAKSVTELFHREALKNIPILAMAKNGPGASGFDAQAAFQKLLKEKQDRKKEMDNTKGSLDTGEGAQEYRALTSAIADLTLASTGSTMGMASAAQYLTPFAGEIIAGMVASTGLTTADWAILATLPGMNENLLRTMQKNTDWYKSVLESLTSDKNLKAVTDILTENQATLEAGSKASEKDVAKLIKQIDTSNLAPEDKLGMKDIVQRPKEALELIKTLKQGEKDFRRIAVLAAVGSDDTDVLGDKRISKDSQKKMVKELTPLQKYLGITEDAANLAMADSDAVRNTADAAIATATYAGKILAFMLRGAEAGSTINTAQDTVDDLEERKQEALADAQTENQKNTPEGHKKALELQASAVAYAARQKSVWSKAYDSEDDPLQKQKIAGSMTDAATYLQKLEGNVKADKGEVYKALEKQAKEDTASLSFLGLHIEGKGDEARRAVIDEASRPYKPVAPTPGAEGNGGGVQQTGAPPATTVPTSTSTVPATQSTAPVVTDFGFLSKNAVADAPVPVTVQAPAAAANASPSVVTNHVAFNISGLSPAQVVQVVDNKMGQFAFMQPTK